MTPTTYCAGIAGCEVLNVDGISSGYWDSYFGIPGWPVVAVKYCKSGAFKVLFANKRTSMNNQGDYVSGDSLLCAGASCGGGTFDVNVCNTLP